MTQRISRVLVAVKDVGRRSSRMLLKAAKLARGLDAKLELFHAISEPLAVEALWLANQSVDNFEERQRLRALKRLEALAEPLRRNGLVVTTSVEWDYPVHEAVIRQARRSHADLIIAERHGTRHVAPWFLRYADWELIRHSPVPVLLMKTARQYEQPKVLAAVDPSHAFAKTSSLDDRILSLGGRVSTATGGQLHVVHCYVPDLVDMTPKALSAPDATAQIISRAATRARERLEKALRSARLGTLPPGRRHLASMHPMDAIPALVQQLHCDIMVMGSLSRTGLKRLAIGNTAERLLDDLPCDLLVVKAPAFKTRVPARSRGAQLVALSPTSGIL